MITSMLPMRANGQCMHARDHCVLQVQGLQVSTGLGKGVARCSFNFGPTT